MKICVAGACGRMGRRILELAAAAEDVEIESAIDVPALAGSELTVGQESGRPRKVVVTSDIAAGLASADVLVDFTVAEASVCHVRAAAELHKPAVVGTTGFNDHQKMELASFVNRVALVWAPNMSIGVNLLFKITEEVARILGLGYNVEIVETHHALKKDSPSGTAIRLAERAAEALGLDMNAEVIYGRHGILGPRPTRQIAIHALRGGDVVGDHTVCFIGKGERIELTHRAHSRDTFAQGALRAARFALTAPPGLYDMQDVLGLK